MVARGKKIYLCSPDMSLTTLLNGVIVDSVNYSPHVKDYDALTFDVDEFIIKDGEKIKSNGYDLLDTYMNLYLEDIGYFQMQTPSKTNDGDKEIKSITAYSLEKEFEQKDWLNFKVNTGEADSLEQLATDNLNDLGFAKEFVTFYNPDNEELSLLHLVLTKMPGWSIVDEEIDRLLWAKKILIEEENINLYALLTSVIAPKIECIFTFDTINKRVGAIAKASLDDYTYDTNIFIGFRNLCNSIGVTVDEDSVFTRFNCRGDGDLTVSDWNYNDTKIIDLSYFMRQPYMSDELIEKVNRWLSWRENNRESFANLAKKQSDINDKIYEIRYRVPNDGDDWSQWDEMTEELLNQNLTYYNALLTSLQVSVDSSPTYNASGNYVPWKTTSGDVNHDAYLALLYDMSNGYGGYYTYYEILNYIIPNIEIAISNLGIPEEEKTDYVEAYETNWELYGTEELTAKKKDYENRLKVLEAYSKPWSSMTDEEKAQYVTGEDQYNSAGRSEYVKISGYLGSETKEGTLLYYLKKLNNEIDVLNEELDEATSQRNKMVQTAQLEHESYGFTSDEIITVNTLFHDTDYTNSNILTTSVDTTLTTIDREKELYDDAVSKLSEASQPQYSFSVDLDNLLQIPEFQSWIDNFKLLNFFRLGLKDDYSVKLRMIGYSYNPCDITSSLTIEFSSMVTSRSGRSDLTDLLNSENNRGSKNSISIGTGNSDTDKEYLTALLQLMIQNKLFTNAVGNIAGNTVASTTINEAEIQTLISKYIKTEKIDVKQITGDEASFEILFSKYIDADTIVGDSGKFKTLDAYIANLQQAIIGTSSTETGIIFNFSSKNATMDEAWIASLVAEKISVADLKTHAATANRIDLISSATGDPSISFQNATQQFFDGNGNIRVQIGQDGNGNFNFIIRGTDGTTALFDQDGIHKEGIPDNVIVNNMIEDNTIQKVKLGFKIIEPNEYGGVDISKIYDGDTAFGAEYTSFKENITSEVKDLSDDISDLSDYIQSVELIGDQVFVEEDGVISPSSITITADIKNGLVIGKWYIDGVENTSYVASDKKSITIPASFMSGKKSISIKVEGTDTTKYDIMNVYRVSDGSDAVTVVITSDNGTVFKDAGTTTTTTLSCNVYKGSSQVRPNSYTWYVKDGNSWTATGDITQSITVKVPTGTNKKIYKCSVDL